MTADEQSPFSKISKTPAFHRYAIFKCDRDCDIYGQEDSEIGDKSDDSEELADDTTVGSDSSDCSQENK